MSETTNILLVDDKPERLLTYEVILERLGQNLQRASSGQEAYEKLQGMQFAAVLLDVSMPGMDGFETAALIRESPRFGKTPIIFVTGVHISDRDRLRGYEMGAADYVYVPVVPEILRGKVQVLVQLDLQRRELTRLNDQLAATNEQLEKAHARMQAKNLRELRKLNQNLASANRQLVSEVAERKRAESLLIEAARRKDEFISILGHELRNPLAAMQGGIELLHLSPIPDGKLPWARELLQRQLSHLKRLIDELLDASRIKTGRVQLQREVLELHKVIEHSLDATRPLMTEREVDLNVDLPADPLYLHGDSLRLTQVFSNLLTNAAKYTGKGGCITLSAEAEPGAGAFVSIRVKDTGTGIAEDMLERVFDLFTQANNEDATNRSGLGIGLALVRTLVELHGGTAHAASGGLGHGSEFTVRLPLFRESRQDEPQTDRPAAGAGQIPPMRLLIIDDNADMATGLQVYLSKKFGADVRVENKGENGVEAAVEFEPDAVLLDIGLPDIDGYEVARRLRGRAAFADIPLIAISGFSSETDRERAKKAGFDDFIVKPVAFDSLVEILSGCRAPRSRSAASG